MSPPQIAVAGPLDARQLSDVTALVEAATDADGVRPLSEHVMLHLRYGGERPVRHVLAYLGGELAGYAHLDTTDLVEGASAEVVVHPAHRKQGVARQVVEVLLRETPDGRLRLWAHGEHPGSAALARALGFRRSRVLEQWRRSLYAALPAPQWPEGVVVRTFRPGEDDHAWVALNRTAFADHPEQGRWTVHDLHIRMREPWFDPAGFFVAEAGGRMAGFHWTKVHGGTDDGGPGHQHGHGHDPVGEVYVVGVDRAFRGSGLGTALTLAGLRHLRSRGLAAVMLYVDADNAAALRLYRALGFTHWETDAMFSNH